MRYHWNRTVRPSVCGTGRMEQAVPQCWVPVEYKRNDLNVGISRMENEDLQFGFRSIGPGSSAVWVLVE